jgi:hypothetical protein
MFQAREAPWKEHKLILEPPLFSAKVGIEGVEKTDPATRRFRNSKTERFSCGRLEQDFLAQILIFGLAIVTYKFRTRIIR